MRETLSRQVALARPLGADPAGQAIRRAKRIRRRRTAAGLAVAAVITVLLSAGMAQLGAETGRNGSPILVIGDPDPSNRPIPTASIRAPPLARDVVGRPLLSETLVSADGKRLVLPDVGPADRVQPCPTAVVGWWSVHRAPPDAPLGGAERRPGAGAAGRGGRDRAGCGQPPGRLARRRRPAGGRCGRHAAHRGGAHPAPATAEPVRFVGESVLVRLDPSDAGHTLWRPGTGQLPAATDQKTLNVYGRLPDGRLVGQIATTRPDRTCLAVLDPARRLNPVRTGCGPTLSRDGIGDLRRRAVAAGERVDRQDQSVPAGRPPAARSGATAVPAGPPMTGAIVWSDETTASYLDDTGGLVHVDVGPVWAGKPASPAPVPGVQAGDRPLLVPSL
ncbi:hypothetical protein NKG94_30575 [Micromonospora sp. M12]